MKKLVLEQNGVRMKRAVVRQIDAKVL